jgi:acyl carrier protein
LVHNCASCGRDGPARRAGAGGAPTGGVRAMDHKRQIKQFVLKNYLFTEDESALADSDSLIRGGTVDSTGMLELIAHLEETWSIKVADAEMVPANFDSLVAIGDYVSRKLSA